MVDIGGERTAALEQLVREEYTRLVRAVCLVSTDVQSAEDAVQEALARAWGRMSEGSDIDQLGGWVVTVALNLVRSGHRRTRRLTALDQIGGASTSGLSSDESIDMRRAVRALPNRQREVVVLHYFLDLDVRTVAEVLGRSEGAVKNALFHARAALARTLDDTWEVPT